MNSPIADKQDQLEELCSKYSVAILELFGSACKGGYVPDQSDLDFLVRFKPCPPEEHAQRYFGLLSSLQDLFLCDIDLVETTAIRNPYFLEGIAASRMTLYTA